MKTISSGTSHKLTSDLKTAILADNEALAAWQSLTPLARNEWICWVIFPKQAQTRADHVRRTVNELKAGKRRPCCWLGCTHRTDKAVSPSVKAILNKHTENK